MTLFEISQNEKNVTMYLRLFDYFLRFVPQTPFVRIFLPKVFMHFTNSHNYN